MITLRMSNEEVQKYKDHHSKYVSRRLCSLHREYKKCLKKHTKGFVCDYGLPPTSFQHNTAREMRIKAQSFCLPRSISIFLCGSILSLPLSHTHTHIQSTYSPSASPPSPWFWCSRGLSSFSVSVLLILFQPRPVTALIFSSSLS